jgi:hypothetical protein
MLREKVRAISSNYLPAVRRFLLVPVLVAGLVLPFSVFSAAPASAWAGPCSSACHGGDPNAWGCGADARTVATNGFWRSDGVRETIELRYSPTCQANWALISPAPAGWQFYAKDAWGNRVYETVGYDNSYWYGNMVDGARTAWACFLNGVCASA